jgi:PAS domain S-box-containing protein
VVVTEPDGTYSFVNKAWEEYFGYGRASALGKKTMPWMPQDISFDGTQLNEQLISGQVKRAVRERRVVLADGVTREWIYQRSLLTRADGTPAGTIGTITDIAERKRAEAEMKRLSDEALEAARAKSAFLATMSHEIRTPMNGVIGMAEVLANTSLTREQRDSVDTIRKSGETLLAIINDILDYSKVESGNIELEKRDVEVHVLIEDIFELFAVTARSRAIDLLYLIDSNVPRTVVGDETRLRQVLSNLVGNALKFTRQGSVTIEVKGQREGAEFLLEVEVRDTGIGIPAERLDRLFKPFSQVDASTTREYGGTGLGLAICQRLVQLMGGDIRVESTPGKGSNFIFTVRVGEAAATAKRYVAQDETQLRGREALLVDDNPVNLRILRSQCENWGMQVWTAESAEDALRLVDERHFDIGVLDIHMPGVNGFELAARIHASERGARLPLIALSSAPGDATDADRANFRAFLRKPVRQSALFTTLAGAVSKMGASLASAEARAGTAQRREAAPLPSAGGKGRILLVEDNEINQGVAASLLGFLGYEVELAENGLLACEAAASKTYDLILMDVQMPVMDGLEATRRIISNAGSKPRPRIVAMTANAMLEDRERCAEAGMEDYLAKPFKLADLRTLLERNMPAQGEKAPTEEHSSSAVEEDTTIEEERLDELAKLTSADRVGKLIEAFDRNGADYLRAMRDAPDIAQFRQSAHALKGMSLTLGARRLGELCERWQNIGDDCGAKTLEEAVAGLEHEFRLAGDALRRYRAWRENPSSRALN